MQYVLYSTQTSKPYFCSINAAGVGGCVLSVESFSQLFCLLKAAVLSWGRIANELNFTFEDKIAITCTPGLHGDEDYFQALLHRWLNRVHHCGVSQCFSLGW